MYDARMISGFSGEAGSGEQREVWGERDAPNDPKPLTPMPMPTQYTVYIHPKAKPQTLKP